MKAFFIVGVQRSGTTLLSVMLSKHPDILLERRSIAFRIVTCFKNMYELLPHNLEVPEKDFLDWLIENDHDGRLNELLAERNPEEATDVRQLLEQAIGSQLKKNGKILWGDKSPNLQHFVADLLLLIPDAKFLHIVRDGRATAASMVRRTGKNLKLSAQEWVDGNIFGLVNQQIVGKKNYHLLRYEDLLSQPKSTMRAVCDFLEIPYSDQLLDLQDAQVSAENRYVPAYFDKEKLDSWEEDLSISQIKTIEKIQGPLLQKMGYDLLTPADQFRFQPLPVRSRIWYHQVDNFKQLFVPHKMGMKNREQVKIHRSLKSRVYQFVRVLVQDLVALPIFKSLFSRVFYRKKYYDKKKPLKDEVKL